MNAGRPRAAFASTHARTQLAPTAVPVPLASIWLLMASAAKVLLTLISDLGL